MIAVDSSALVAITLDEPGARILGSKLVSRYAFMSTANFFETQMVVFAREGNSGLARLDSVVSAGIDEMVAVDERHAEAAFTAWQVWGKGRHPASLNYGDCFAYATAQLASAPLLYIGNDFSQTDINSAIT